VQRLYNDLISKHIERKFKSHSGGIPENQKKPLIKEAVEQLFLPMRLSRMVRQQLLKRWLFRKGIKTRMEIGRIPTALELMTFQSLLYLQRRLMII